MQADCAIKTFAKRYRRVQIFNRFIGLLQLKTTNRVANRGPTDHAGYTVSFACPLEGTGIDLFKGRLSPNAPSCFSLGFTNSEDACCGAGGFSNSVTICGDLGATVCANPNEYAFWDQLHPTTAYAQLLAKEIFGGSTFVHPKNVLENFGLLKLQAK
jgi:hypothetical protein